MMLIACKNTLNKIINSFIHEGYYWALKKKPLIILDKLEQEIHVQCKQHNNKYEMYTTAIARSIIQTRYIINVDGKWVRNSKK